MHTYRCGYCGNVSESDVCPTCGNAMFNARLKDTTLWSPFICDTDDYTLCVEGDVVINTFDCPLQASGRLNITGSGTLKLQCHSSMQPCIGANTRNGLSYGRWEPSSAKPLNTIRLLGGVTVICESPNETFALGTYGKEEVPDIVVEDILGRLVCPETAGKRVMLKDGSEDLYGSTKRENPAVYEIVPEEDATMKVLHNIPMASVRNCETNDELVELVKRFI